MAKKLSELPILNEGALLDGLETIVFNKDGITYKGALVDLWKWKLDISGVLPKANPISTGKFTTAASVVGAAGLRIPHGVAPTTNVDGDIWTRTTGLFVRINGVSKQVKEVTLCTAVTVADAAATLTAAQLVSGMFVTTPTAARTFTTDTAAAMVALLPGYVAGTNFEFAIVNNAAFAVTLVGGTGITLVGKTSVTDASATWKVVINSATTATIYRI